MAIPESLRGQLRLPVIGSPLFIVSNSSSSNARRASSVLFPH
jgi:hypothetical protein